MTTDSDCSVLFRLESQAQYNIIFQGTVKSDPMHITIPPLHHQAKRAPLQVLLEELCRNRSMLELTNMKLCEPTTHLIKETTICVPM